ncbi:hypothetical protein C8R43DRAFT_1031737 [Mycena crocata]|nr:hypothetical protein C8R43DRAFT_1031737 [Mycena crocata]
MSPMHISDITADEFRSLVSASNGFTLDDYRKILLGEEEKPQIINSVKREDASSSIDHIIQHLVPIVNNYLAHDTPDGVFKTLQVTIGPNSRPVCEPDSVFRTVHENSTTKGVDLTAHTELWDDDRGRVAVEQAMDSLVRGGSSVFGCDAKVSPGVLQSYQGLDPKRPERTVTLLRYHTPQDLVAEWLVGAHYQIPWKNRMLAGENCQKVVDSTWPEQVPDGGGYDSAYPQRALCDDDGYRLYFGIYDPKFRKPGVVRKVSGKRKVFYETREDFEAEFRAGKYPLIPRDRREIAVNERDEKYWDDCRIRQSDYPARPLDASEVPPCNDPEIAKLFGTEVHSGVVGRRFAITLAISVERKAKRIYDYATRTELMSDWLLGIEPNVPYENRVVREEEEEAKIKDPEAASSNKSKKRTAAKMEGTETESPDGSRKRVKVEDESKPSPPRKTVKGQRKRFRRGTQYWVYQF